MVGHIFCYCVTVPEMKQLHAYVPLFHGFTKRFACENEPTNRNLEIYGNEYCGSFDAGLGQEQRKMKWSLTENLLHITPYICTMIYLVKYPYWRRIILDLHFAYPHVKISSLTVVNRTMTVLFLSLIFNSI